jgi:hypothetical protein
VVEFEGDQVPGSQVLHAVDADEKYVPAEQTMQDAAPAMALYEPATHDLQLAELVAPVYGR